MINLRIAFLICASLLLTACATTNNQSQCLGSEASTERLFLEQMSHDSVLITWRGAAEKLCYGTSQSGLNTEVNAKIDGKNKLAKLSGLSAETKYFYSVGGAPNAPDSQHFITAPRTGAVPKDGTSRFWILGDSGTASQVDNQGKPKYPGAQQAVIEGFNKFNTSQADKKLDLILLLGDNAYTAGTDQQWQTAYFDIYSDILKSVASVPTIGNHEMGYAPFDICRFMKVEGCANGAVEYMIGGASFASDHLDYDGNRDGIADGTGMPYFEIFNIPTKAELGGVASGTEHYYSINYANVHIVSLDSQLSTQDQAQMTTMKEWLIADLSSNQQDWTVVIFHHPPYSKGENHDSDIEQREIDMRTTFAPLFEAHGVDVVYSGHAHNYERSWYLNGHHGKSDTFDAHIHAELNTKGEPLLGQLSAPYQQISPSSGLDDKAVYTVAGNAGKAGKFNPCKEGVSIGCTTPTWLMHPAHRSFEPLAEDYLPHGIARMGSVVLEATETTLTSRFIDLNGEQLDYFIIQK